MNPALLDNVAFRNITKWIAVMMAVKFIGGVYNNLHLLGPLSFSENFHKQVQLFPQRFQLGIWIYVLLTLLTLVTAFSFFYLIRSKLFFLPLIYLSVAVLHTGIQCVDIGALSWLKSLGSASTPNTLWIQTAQDFRYQIHLLELMTGLLHPLLLFLLLYKEQQIPIGLAILGWLAPTLGLFSFGHTWLGGEEQLHWLMPMALLQIVFPIWLFFKGFQFRQSFTT